MFDPFESMSIWLNACARVTHAWTQALDQASALFHNQD